MNEENIFKILLKLSKRAFKSGEIPIACIILKNNEIISYSYNMNNKKHSQIEHAEMIAIRKAEKKLKNPLLYNCKIYINVEPCIMCSFAIVLSRISEVVYVLKEPKFGGLYSLYQIANDIRLNHQVIVRNVHYFEKEFENLLKKYFKNSRLKK